MESILTSVKKMLGITEEYTHFDNDIVMHINSVFMVLQQLGVGPSYGFYIEDATATWADFFGYTTNLQMVKSYVYLKVRLLFDPPASSTILNSMNQMIDEFEWRLNHAAETGAFNGASDSSQSSETPAVFGVAELGRVVL